MMGGRELLEKVDDVVVGNSQDTIELEADEAEAAFYGLNVSVDAPSAEQRLLGASRSSRRQALGPRRVGPPARVRDGRKDTWGRRKRGSRDDGAPRTG
jgi:hypothetical protein